MEVKDQAGFFKQSIDTLVTQLSSDIHQGLPERDVPAKQKKYGLNILKSNNSRSKFIMLFEQFKDLLVIVFIIAGLLDFYLGQVRDGTILIIIVISNSLIGFFQELKSENILASLKKLVVAKCKVIRDGKTLEIVVDDLVPGDVVQLYEGDGIPADIRHSACQAIHPRPKYALGSMHG
jgi:Ca2+-transporting ATPase